MATTAVTTALGSADRPAGGALRVPNVRLYLAGQAVSQAGTWLQLVALGWLGFELTGSGTALGWVAAATFGPLLLLGPWTGALADRVDKHRLLALTQLMAAVPAGALGLLVLTGSLTVPLLYGTALACGLVYAVENPVRHAFVAELVEHRLIPAAVGLTSAVGAAGRVLGPLGAGVLLATTDIAWCFLANAISNVLALAGLLAMHRGQLHPTSGDGSSVASGLRYAWRVPELRTALVLTAVVATFGFNHQVLVPLLAHRTFSGGSGTYTLLYSAMSIGAVLGAVVAARRRSVDVRFLGRATVGFGAATGLVAIAPTLPLAVVAGAASGGAGLLFVATATALLQQRSDPAMRGRVMALAAMVIVGGLPIGGPIVGWVAELTGPRGGLALGATAALAAGAAVLSRLPSPTPSAHAGSVPWPVSTPPCRAPSPRRNHGWPPARRSPRAATPPSMPSAATASCAACSTGARPSTRPT